MFPLTSIHERSWFSDKLDTREFLSMLQLINNITNTGTLNFRPPESRPPPRPLRFRRLHVVQNPPQSVQQALQGPRPRAEGSQGHPSLLRVHQLQEALLKHGPRPADGLRELRPAQHVEAVRGPARQGCRRRRAGQAVRRRRVRGERSRLKSKVSG